MNSFILSRTDERATKSVGRILLYALLFYVVSRLLSGVLIAAVTGAYHAAGCADPLGALRFGGMPSEAAKNFGAGVVWMIMLGAPLLEEVAFRLGLSFRRPHAALGLGVLVAFLAMRLLPAGTFFSGYGGAAIVALVVAAAVWRFTTDAFWSSKRAAWQVPAGWISAVGFGLAHLFAMQGLTPALLPMALCLCFMLACAGCVFVYLRVNLGFWWGLGAHMLNNIPALFVLLAQSLPDGVPAGC